MQINPKIVQATGALCAVTGVLMGAGSQFTTIFGQGEANQIVAGLSLSTMALGALMGFFGRFASSDPGPGAPQDPPVVVAATKVADLPSDAHPAEVAAAKKAATDAVVAHNP